MNALDGGQYIKKAVAVDNYQLLIIYIQLIKSCKKIRHVDHYILT
jgi:hypothetical protein